MDLLATRDTRDVYKELLQMAEEARRHRPSG